MSHIQAVHYVYCTPLYSLYVWHYIMFSSTALNNLYVWHYIMFIALLCTACMSDITLCLLHPFVQPVCVTLYYVYCTPLYSLYVWHYIMFITLLCTACMSDITLCLLHCFGQPVCVTLHYVYCTVVYSLYLWQYNVTHTGCTKQCNKHNGMSDIQAVHSSVINIM